MKTSALCTLESVGIDNVIQSDSLVSVPSQKKVDGYILMEDKATSAGLIL